MSRVEPGAKRWTTVSDSSYDHEREALAWLRRRLPDRDPVRVWANFEFVARSGALYEVDALAVTSAGIYLIEVKSHPGEIGGDGTTWVWTRPDGSRGTFDNPRLLANRKAKHLADLLDRSNAFRKKHAARPYVQEVIFLSDPDLTVSLAPPGRFQVFGRDAEPGEELPAPRSKIGGIVDTITSLDPDGSGRPKRRIDRPLGDLIAKAVDEIGIRELTSRRRVGDYKLGDLLEDVEQDRDTGITYQDFLATHTATEVQRRIRIYPLERNATEDERTTAARAAKREFQLLHALDDPGILCPLDYTDSDRGPALIFAFDPEEQPLHRWLQDPGVSDQLGVFERLQLLRLMVEAIAAAHRSGVTHRALSPSAVLVAGSAQNPRVRITNWHAGARIQGGDASTRGTTGTVHVEALSADDAAFYRAPEFGLPNAKASLLDIFSLGALATLVFTDRAPADTPSAYRELLETAGCIPADALGDGLDDSVVHFVERTTNVDPAQRAEDIATVLELVDFAEEFLTLPDAPTEPPPDEAVRGQTLGGGRFLIEKRLGRGSTAIAFEVVDKAHEERVAVLKVAADREHNGRLVAEAEALSELHHQYIVQLLDGPLDLDGHTALLLSHAGSTTLAARLADQPGPELAERFGDDLLDAVRHLEERGISHRDLKPENMGITKLGVNDRLHLVLFDFSLAKAPLDQIGAGTPGYVDPFLKQRGAWDLHAERYAAAVTLHELTAGTKPRYGNDDADPTLTDAPLVVDPSAFEPSVAEGLVAFFESALAPKVADRFDTADDMLRSWRRAFEPASQPATPVEATRATTPDDGQSLVVPTGTTSATPLSGLPLSNRSVNALEREGILTVGELLDFPPSRVPQLRGVGSKTRTEILFAVAALRAHAGKATTVAETDTPAPDDTLVDLAATLVPTTTRSDQQTTLTVLGRLLGLDDAEAHWPTQTELGELAGVTRARVSQIVLTARSRWAKQPPVTELRGWIAEELSGLADLVTAEQLVDLLLRARPDDADPLARRNAATALVRAALLAEDERDTPRWVLRRRQGRMVVAAEAGTGDPTGQRLADYAAALAAVVDELVAPQVVVTRPRLVDALRAVPAPDAGRPLPDAHLAELAVALSEHGAVNARLELYPKGLSAAEALRLCRRAFAATAHLAPDDLAKRVRARFPDAEPLPSRPELDELVAAAELELRWDDEAQAYLALDLVGSTGTSAATTFRRHATGVPADFVPIELDAATDFESRLERSIDTGGLLVLATEPDRLEDAADELERFPVHLLDLDQLVLDRLAELTADGKPTWQLVVEADASGPGSTPWERLTKLVDRAFVEVTDRLFAVSGTVALHRLGLLARYSRMDLIAEWRDRLYAGDGALRALWLIVSVHERNGLPTIDDKEVRVLSGNEWSRIPRTWLENAHRAGRVAGGPTP